MAAEIPTKPGVLLISLEFKSFFDEMYEALLDAFHSKSTIKRVKQANSAISELSREPRPSAVLVTDEGLTTNENSHVWEAVLQYVRGGGVCVVMGNFPAFVLPDNMKPFFAKAGLPWESGPYHRTTLVLNTEATGQDLATRLPSQYSQKALFVKNVTPADSWYVTNVDSVTESRVLPQENADTPGKTPVAFARVGVGKLGYVGDVNAEKGSDAAILAMCGLL
ncbi:triacylglycerol lipase [Ilyonectria destructans]|nr:triacylglycerol lipase [Ilyonectria destructans]